MELEPMLTTTLKKLDTTIQPYIDERGRLLVRQIMVQHHQSLPGKSRVRGQLGGPMRFKPDGKWQPMHGNP